MALTSSNKRMPSSIAANFWDKKRMPKLWTSYFIVVNSKTFRKLHPSLTNFTFSPFLCSIVDSRTVSGEIFGHTQLILKCFQDQPNYMLTSFVDKRNILLIILNRSGIFLKSSIRIGYFLNSTCPPLTNG